MSDQLVSLEYVIKCINAIQAAAAKSSPNILTNRDDYLMQLGALSALNDLREALSGRKYFDFTDERAHEAAWLGRPINNPRYEVPDDDD